MESNLTDHDMLTRMYAHMMGVDHEEGCCARTAKLRQDFYKLRLRVYLTATAAFFGGVGSGVGIAEIAKKFWSA